MKLLSSKYKTEDLGIEFIVDYLEKEEFDVTNGQMATHLKKKLTILPTNQEKEKGFCFIKSNPNTAQKVAKELLDISNFVDGL